MQLTMIPKMEDLQLVEVWQSILKADCHLARSCDSQDGNLLHPLHAGHHPDLTLPLATEAYETNIREVMRLRGYHESIDMDRQLTPNRCHTL